ncbi:MAG: hypothetical protein GX995_09930 [Clostridiales bacterium]|jgi:hypothetical protein|nr:hypothetical protein [Clostridiales bacterium]
MSAFLGPIHYWLHGKIKIQDSIVEDILAFAKEEYGLDYREYLDTEYGIIEKEALEEIIDESNIHGWLQERIHRVERHLAYTVTNVLKEHPEALDKLKEIYKNTGIRQARELNIGQEATASILYKAAVNDSLLDGMPCDHVNAVSSQEEDSITWKRSICVHEEFWNEVDGDISIYYLLRDEYINGFLENTGAKYEKIGDNTYRISK